jgi:eukaryotic-like serine/threonine-protein kinase
LPVEPGWNLLHYRLGEKIGEGGMGEVWRATDTTLGRDVAIKILPAVFASDPERLARFEREAKVLASLNHPNIAAIHGFHEADGVRFLAMELVPGEGLDQLIARGPVPVAETRGIALKIAEALEYAHERGIVHRDLKPANVKITPDGIVKVLDFGLAKAIVGEISGGGPTSAPTILPTVTSAGTAVGMILGTAAYMSPEQARGKAVDRRTDIWAFGVVVAEMLTGRRLFDGETVSDTIAGVLTRPIDMSSLPLAPLLRRCLERDSKLRLRDIGEARIALEEAMAGREWTGAAAAVDAPAAPRRRPLVAALLVAAGLAAGAAVTAWWSGSRGAAPVLHLAIPLPPALRVTIARLTPDGRTVIFYGRDVSPGLEARDRGRLYVRPLDRDEPIVVAGSDNESWLWALSPDGRSLAFVTRTTERSSRLQLVRAPLDQSAPAVKITDWPDEAGGLLWPTAETIVAYRSRDGAILPLPTNGGAPGTAIHVRGDTPPHTVDASGVLPGGRQALVTNASFESGTYRQSIQMVDLTTGELKRLIDDGSNPTYAAPRTIVFSRRDALLAVPFDPARMVITGGPRSMGAGLWAQGLFTGGHPDVSAAGHLVYAAGDVQEVSRRLAIATRDGALTDWSADRLPLNEVRVSPDGRRVAVMVDNVSEGDALLQIRVSSFERPRLLTVGSKPGMDCSQVVWSTGSNQLAWTCSDRKELELLVGPADGGTAAKVVLHVASPTTFDPVGFTADDSHVLVLRHDVSGKTELVKVTIGTGAGSSTEGQLVAVDEKELEAPCISHDGRLLAYSTNETGRSEAYVRELRADGQVGPRIPLVSDGTHLRWAKTLRNASYELFFRREGGIFSVDFTPGPSAKVSAPQRLRFDPYALDVADWDTLPDGRLLVVAGPDTEHGANELRLVLNWTQLLDAR